MIELSAEEIKKVQNKYLDSLKAKCKFQLLFGPNPFETYIILNDEVVGCVQEVSVHVEADKQLERKIEVIFPKFDWQSNATEFWKDGAKALELLGFITVKYKEIKSQPTKQLSEEIEKVFVSSSDADFEKSCQMVRELHKAQNEQAS